MVVQPLGQEDPLKKEMETHSSILAWQATVQGVAKESDVTYQLNHSNRKPNNCINHRILLNAASKAGCIHQVYAFVFVLHSSLESVTLPPEFCLAFSHNCVQDGKF